MQETAKIVVRLNINIFLHLNIFLRIELVIPLVAQITDEHVFFQVNIVEVREDDLITFIINEVIQRICLPFSGVLPVVEHDVVDKFFILVTQHGSWRNETNILGNGVEQFFWMEASRYIVEHSCGDVHTQLAAIFLQFEQFHVAVAINGFIITNNGRNELANRQNGNRFSVFLAGVNGNSVIYAIFVLEDQSRISYEAIAEEHFKFFCILWSICPTSSRFDAGLHNIHDAAVTSTCEAIFSVANDDTAVVTCRDTTHDGKTFFDECTIHTSDDARCSHVGVFLTTVFNEACLNFFVRTKDHFLIKLANGHPNRPWTGTIDNGEVRAVRAWWPRRTRPVPYERFLTSFCEYIPQLFSLAITRINVVAYIVQAERAFSVVPSDPMNICVATSCQRCPHWRGNCWMPTEHHKVFALSATFNEFLNVRHLPFAQHAFRKTWIETVNT